MAQLDWDAFLKNRTYNYVTRTPEQFDAGRHIGEEPRGLLGSAWDNLWGGMEGMVGGLADTAGTMLKAGYEEGRADERGGLLGKWLVDRAIDLNQHAAENARRSGVRNEYSDMGILDRLTSPSYLFDPRGLTAEVSNMTGSMVPFMLMSAAMPEFGAAGVAGLIGRGLSRIGANKIAGLFEPGGAVTGFLRDGFRWAPTGVADAMSNAGEVAEEMRRQGYTDAQIADRIGSAMSYELPYDVVSQGLFGGFLGGKGVRKFAEGGGIGRNIAANTALGGFEALNEAGQEFVQTQAVEQALGKPVGTFMNPTDEERRAFDAAFIGTLPMVAAGGARNVTKNWLRGKAESVPSELQSSAPVKTSGDENIDSLIAQAAEKYGVPVNLLHSIAQTESGYNQGAKSEAGAIGMMQLMPDTAAGLGVDPNDLAGNIEGGAKYLREMLDTFDDDVEKAVAAYNAGPNAVKKHGGIPPFEETRDYVRKVMGGLDGYDASIPQRMRSLLEDATQYLGMTMDNGENGCVEAVTKIGAKSCPFLAQELSNGVVNVDRLVADAGNNVIPFDPNQLEEGDVIVYGDESDPQRHVVLYDGKGGYIGNSTEQNKVVQGADYNAMGNWTPTKIIKTGAQFGGAHSAAPVMPDFTGLIADETNIKETQEAIQKLIDTDTMTPEQHAAILQAAEMARDTPIGSGTDPAAEAESVNEWQRLIDRKDAKGIFEKDPKRIVQHLQRLEKTQKMQRTRAAIENQQQIEATKQALATVQQAQSAQSAQTVPTQGDASVQQIVPEQTAQLVTDGRISPTIPQVGDMQGTNAAQMSAPIQPENVMQNPQMVQGTDGQIVPQNILAQNNHAENVFDAPAPQNAGNSAVPTSSEALAAGITQGTTDTQPMPRPMETQANMADVQQAILQREVPLLSIPAYVQARQSGDLNAAAQIAQQVGANDVAQLYGMLLAHRDGQAAHVTPYAPQQKTPQAAAVPVKAPVPVVGVRPNVPVKLPDKIEARRALGISLNKFMTDNNLQFAQNGRLDLVAGRGQTIRAAEKKITAWEKNRAEQEARAVQNGSVHTRQTAQEGAQGTQNTVQDRMLAQHSAEPQNGSQTVREKSAQNQGNKKAADKGGVSEGASVSTEPESLNEPSETPSIHAPSSTSTISSEAEESKEKPLSENEREAVKGLSADAKNVYQMVRDKLTGMKNKKVARAASAGAVLLARHADIIARKVRATLGTPFTAMDYYRTWFDLQYGKGADGFTQTTAARRLKEDMLAWKQKVDDFLAGKLPLRNNIIMRSPLVFDLIGADSTLDIAIDSNVLQKLVDKHHFTRKDLLELPKKIADPLFVLRAIDTKTGVEDTQKRIVVVDMEINGATVMIPFVLNTSKGLNKIASAYGREKASGQPNDQWYIDRLNPKNLLYINKNRTVRWVATRTGAAGSHNAPLTKQSFSTISIADENDLSKLKKENPGFYQRRAELPDAERKEMQFRIIEETNPMHDDIHTGIRSVDDILTAKEAFETKVDEDESYLYPDFTETDGKAALKNGEVTIYSSYPIAPGVFVTPSKMQAQDYAGGGKVYSKTVSVKDVAWIHCDEGQYAPIETESFNQSAWHGTPHDFDGFDLGAIGTGEGAQVHGWGLYFAKLRETANGYKERLKKPGFFYDGKEKKELPTDIQEALDSVFKGRELFIHDNAEAKKRLGQALVEMQKNVDRARESLAEIEEYVHLIKQNPNMSVPELLKKMGAIESVEEVSNEEVSSEELSYNNMLKEVEVAKTSSEKELREYQRAYGLLQKIDPEKIETIQPGSLFEVEIPDDDVLLDEQKSLADQHEDVKIGLDIIMASNDGYKLLSALTYDAYNKEYAEVAREYSRLRDLSIPSEMLGREGFRFTPNFLRAEGYTEKEIEVINSNPQKADETRQRLAEKYAPRLRELKQKLDKFADNFFKDEKALKNKTGRDFYKALSRIYQSDKEASLYLNRWGIKGITYDGRRDGRCFVIFDDKAISIINKFNQQMNAIIKGTTQDVRDGQRIVSLFEEADESTFLHEMGHLFLLDLERLADMSPTSAEELQTVRKWATWSEGQAREYKDAPFAAEFAKLDADIRAALKKGDEKTANKLKRQWEHERFARGFEMYLKHGEAPTKGLRAVFAKFRAFLQRVYQAFTGTGGRATAEVEAVMERMISIEDSSDLSGYPQGKKTAVYTDSGKKIPVQYRVVSADDLIASHDAGALEINPGYPATLQPRDRERVMMRQQVTRMANTLRPEDLADGRNLNQGAPLIRNDGVVLNGNGRTIAIQRAQARNKERSTAYRDYLVENAAAFGFSKEEIENVKNPVLVREVQGDISADIMQDIIGSTTGGARIGASEAAQADAEKITYAMLDAYVPNDKVDLTTAANRNFVAGILHKVVGNGEMNAYLDKDGHVNADGIQRVKRALFACAYGDDELVAKMSESTDDDIRNVSNGMMAAAPMMARLSVKKGVPYVKELQDAIGAAVKKLDALRASGESVKDYLGAQALFAEHEDSAEMRAILSFLDGNKRSGKRIAMFFSHIAKELDEMETPSGNELFDAEIPSLMDVLDGGRSFAVNGGQDNLFDEYIVKEANALYNEAAKKFPDITDKEVADHVREAIQLTLDFGQGNGEIKAVGRGILGDEKLSSHRDVGHTDDYRSSSSLRKESEKELKRGKIYGLGITRKLVNDGAVSLVGQKAKSAADLAEIAQVLRHHGYEKFHYVYVDDAGNVKFHETVTARLPANAPIFLPEDVHQGNNSGEYLENAKRRIVDNMRRFGACKFYLIHNHPSGDPTPSKEDFDVTSALVDLKNTTLTSSFGGHIVLDHNKYAVIDGDMNSAQHVLKNQYKADYYFPEKAHPALGVNVASEDVTQNIADMYGTEAETTAFYLTSKNVVRSVQKIHDNFKDVDEKTQMNYLRYCARSVGGLRVILVTSNKGLYDSIKDRINSGRDDGILDVVLMKDGRALYPEEKYRANKPPSWLGQEYRNVRVEQVLEKKTHYGSAYSAPTIETLLQSSPALKKAALEYGAKDERGKVTFADETRKQEFLKVAKALLSAGERKPSARRQEALKEMLNGIRLIPPTRVSPRKRVLVDWGREMGVPVVFFKGDSSLHGFHQNGVTFLNVDSEITPQWTFWHEAMHWMKANNPDIYNDLVKTINGAEGFTKEQLDAYRNEIGAPNMSDADVIEEMIADALPDARRRVPLLRDIGKRDTGLIQRLVAWIHDVMRRFHDHFYTPKGGLTSLQRRAMVRAFGNLARSIRDAEGKPIFRVGYEGARIILHDKSPLPEVKYSLDNGGREGDNEGGRSTSIEARNQAITDSVTSLFRREVDSLKESGLSEQEIARVLGDEHSDLRTRVLAPWLRQYNQFQAKYPDKRGIVNRIEGRDTTDRSLSNEEISRRFDIFKTRMERMMDDAGLVYAECAHQRASRPSFAGFYSWQGVEQSIREHGGSAEFKERPTTGTKTSLNTKHLETQGAFSMPKLSDDKAKKDADYRNAVRVYHTAGDMADRIRAYRRLKELVREAAAEAGFVNAIPEQTAAYKVRVKAPPKKTVKVYKVFTLADDGSPTALFIGGTEKLPQGVWLDAQDAYHFRAKNGLYYVPSTQNPYTQGGKTGASVEIPNDAVRRELIARGFLPKDSSAAKVTALAYRPGWHAGTLPFFPQGGKKAPQGSPYPNVHRYNQVVFECEMSADKDYTHDAESQPKARTKDGSLNTKKADLQYMPEDGYYYYATNPLTHGHPELGLWAISGSLKINRALSQEECDRILMRHGMMPQGWEQGRMNLSDLGYVSPVQDAARKTLAPITYDDNGHVIPLSERFNSAVDDIRFSANTQEDRKGNFKWLTGAIRSFVGVAPASNLELPGRPTREQILSPKELERRIKERWIQAKNIISQEKQPDGKVKVTYYPDTHDVGYADWIKSVRQVAKRNPFVQALYKRAHAAMKNQERLRNEFGKVLKTFADLVKNPEDLETVSTILWLGDAKGKVYTDAELRSMGASENAIKAYKLVREVLERAYKMLNDARMQVQTRSQTMAVESVETFKKNHWIKNEDVISVQPHRGGQVLLTWRGGKTYDTKDKVITAEALELMKKDDDIIVTRATPLSPTQYGEGMYEVDYVERIRPIHRLTGYMPHFFHEWMVYEKYQDPNTGQIRYTTIGSGRTMNEAVKIGNEIAAKNKDKQYVLRPKGFDLGAENSVVIGDMDFAQMTKKLAESTEMTLTDARAFLQEDVGVSLKSRHRFLGNAMKRKGADGFDKDVMWVLAHYLNSTARYVAMEEFKPWAISMYERFFGSFNNDTDKSLTAKYCKDLINDVNGNPRGVEVWLNDLIRKTWIGKHIADSYGDRSILAINAELSTWNAITKLGLGNFASAAVNFSQFINVGAALNDYGYAAKGLKRALNPSALDEKIIEASGLLDDINMADDNGGYTQRRGGKVRGIYSGVKKGGEWTLIPFQKADTLMRKAAVLGAYYQGVEQKGMKTAPGDELSAEALAYAQEINDDANFDYSSANAPNMLRAGSVVTQQLFQFQKYPIMQFEFMYNILKNGTRGQKVRMFVPYVLFCGIGASIPFGSLFNQLFSFLFGLASGDDEDIAQDIKAEVLRWAGKDPVKKAIAETALYGVLAPTFGLDISGRIGMSNAFAGEFYGEKPDSISGIVGQQIGGPMAVSAINMLRQAHEGNPIEALKALSPALGNMAQAAFGVSRTTRHRVNARYDTAYDKIAHALGFRSVDESNNAFIMNYEYEQKSKLTRTKQEAIQDYLDDPSDANRRTINALGITDKQIKEARIQQERTALERATEGRPNTSRKHGASRHRKEEAKKETLYDTLEDE